MPERQAGMGLLAAGRGVERVQEGVVSRSKLFSFFRECSTPSVCARLDGGYGSTRLARSSIEPVKRLKRRH